MVHKKHKIVYGLPSLLVGGIENQLVQHLSRFDTKKYEFFVVTLFVHKSMPDLYEQLPLHVKVYKLDFNGYLDLKSYAELFRALIEIRPDIVVTSMFSASAVFRVFKLFFRYKIITREHNTYTDRTLFHRIIEKILSLLSDRIIAVSKVVASFYCKQNWVSTSKVSVINNGIDLEKIEAFKRLHGDVSALKEELQLSRSERVMINVARLKKQKNHELLLDVFNAFQKNDSRYRLLILGGGNEMETLQLKIRSLQLENKVMLLGFRKDVFLFYTLSDFFVLSSKIEGFPNVFLEAMSFGLPIVTTNVPGANEIILNGKNGFITNSDEELLEKMIRVSRLNDAERKAMCDACLKTVKMFDVRRSVSIYENLFDSLICE